MGLIDFFLAVSNAGASHNTPPPDPEEDTTLWYISEDGNPAYSGHSPDQPITVDAFLEKNLLAGDTVYFKRGDTFYIGDFAPEVQLTIQGYGSGADPILKGSYSIAGQTWTDNGDGFWYTTMLAEPKWVTIDGQCARQGESDWIPITSAPGYPAGNQRAASSTTLNAFDSVQSLVGAKLRVKEFNFRLSLEMTISAYSSGTITTSTNFLGANVNMPFKLYGQKQFCTLQNDWFYDSGTSRLYVRKSTTPAALDIRVIDKDWCFDLQDISNTSISGIEFTEFYQGALNLDTAHNTYVNAYIHDCRTNGIMVRGNITDCYITGEIERCGLNGIHLGAVQGITFEDLEVHDIGLQLNLGWAIDSYWLKTGGCGIACAPDSAETLKVQNDITIRRFNAYNLGYCGMLLIGNDFLVEDSIVHNVGLKFDDGACFYSVYQTGFGTGGSSGVYRRCIAYDGIGNHDGIASFDLSESVFVGFYIDNGCHNVELDTCTAYNNKFAGSFSNANSEQTRIHDCIFYNNSRAQIVFHETPGSSSSNIYPHNYKNEVYDNVLVAGNESQLIIVTSSVGTGADANYNPFTTGNADNNYYVSPFKTSSQAVASHNTSGTGPFTGGTTYTFANWKARTGEDAASVQKAFYIDYNNKLAGYSDILIVANPSGSTLSYDFPDGIYDDEATSTINSFSIPAWESDIAFIKTGYYLLMDGFFGSSGTMSGRAPTVGPTPSIASGSHNINGSGRMTTSSDGLIVWNLGTNNYNYETEFTVSNTSSVARHDVRMNDDIGSANNRIIFDVTGGNARLREFFSSATATQTLTTALTLSTANTYKLRIECNGSSIKVYLSTNGAAAVQLFSMTTSLTTGGRVGIFGQTTRSQNYAVAYPI